MPYIRLYSRDVPLEEKRLLAQKLISITLRSFQLRPEDREKITIQFLSGHPTWAVEDLPPGSSTQPSDVLLELTDPDLTTEKMTAFVEAAAPMLSQAVPARGRGRIARLLGIGDDQSRQVSFQFSNANSQGKGTPVDAIRVPARSAA
jgi:hypothetical protein